MVLVQAPQKAPVAQPRPTVPQPGMSSGGAAAASALAGLDFSSIKIPKPGEQSTSRPQQRVSLLLLLYKSFIVSTSMTPKRRKNAGYLRHLLQQTTVFFGNDFSRLYVIRTYFVSPKLCHSNLPPNRLYSVGLFSYHSQLKCSFQIMNIG